MTDFDLFEKIFIILVFSVNFSQKYSFIEKGQHYFSFFICFLIFVGIMSMCLNKK